MDLREVVVEPVAARDKGRYQRLMQAHHYLGALPKIGQTRWYVGRWHDEWVALSHHEITQLSVGEQIGRRRVGIRD